MEKVTTSNTYSNTASSGYSSGSNTTLNHNSYSYENKKHSMSVVDDQNDDVNENENVNNKEYMSFVTGEQAEETQNTADAGFQSRNSPTAFKEYSKQTVSNVEPYSYYFI